MFSWLHQWLFCVWVYVIATGETCTSALVCQTFSSQDSTNVKNCTCIIEGTSFPTVLNLCHLDKDYCHIISKTEPDTHPGNIPLTVVRYYILNLFRKIQSNYKTSGDMIQNKVCKQSLSGHTNCRPSKSMCCLASVVTFECSNDQQNSVCMEPQISADSYGYFGKWSIRQPSSDDLREFKTAKAVIQITGGPCYFCPVPKGSNPKELVTLIGLFCDERITDEGHAIPKSGFPSSETPRLIFHLNTSHSCYEFQSKEKCPEAEPVCKSNTFSCTSAKYHFSFPAFANRAISKDLSPTVQYTFGFCAYDVDCSTEGNPSDVEDVLICKKIKLNGQVIQASAVARYKDIDKEVIIRPTGFVWRIKKYGNLKAVVSFQCDADQPIFSKDFNLNVEPGDKKLPVLLLTLKHRCFCPNPPKECSSGGPTVMPIIRTTAATTGKPLVHETLIIVLSLIGSVCLIAFLFVLYVRSVHRRQQTPTTTPSDSPPNSVTQNEPSDPPGSSPPSSVSSWQTACSHLSASITSLLHHRPSTPDPTSRSTSKDQGVRNVENSETVPLLRKKQKKHCTV